MVRRRTFNRINVTTMREPAQFEHEQVKGCLPEVAEVFNENTALRMTRARLEHKVALLEQRCHALEVENAKLCGQLGV